MLRGQTRETFGRSFSLDQSALREGGEAMVKAKDDAGQALFAAGSNLTAVASVLATLEEDADGIWGKRAKASRTYPAGSGIRSRGASAFSSAENLVPIRWHSSPWCSRIASSRGR